MLFEGSGEPVLSFHAGMTMLMPEITRESAIVNFRRAGLHRAVGPRTPGFPDRSLRERVCARRGRRHRSPMIENVLEGLAEIDRWSESDSRSLPTSPK